MHHVALTPRDHEASLRFYQEGLGLQVLIDLDGLTGKWTHIFGAPSDELRSIFLGSPDYGNAGVVELVLFADDPGAADRRRAPAELVNGFFLLSFYVGDVTATIAQLEELGVAGDVRTTTIGEGEGAFTVGTVRDPDGTLIELVGIPPEQGFGD
ncbi:VOC family protein [Mycolicibacterium moriokaense]|nr:VOC family protein [Mycolicibacterium moriokaense]